MGGKRFVLDKLEKGNAILSVQITDSVSNDNYFIMTKEAYGDDIDAIVDLLNELADENEYFKKQLKRFKKWINSDKYDYELTLSFIKNKGYSLKDVLEYEKGIKG